MLGFTQLVSLAAVSSTLLLVDRVKGDVVPTAPGPGDTFNEGSSCPIQWNLDTTGTWTNFTIQLMTGSNQAMTPLLTVASGLDGTTGTGKYEWECPQVDPNSAIYFYQFTQAGSQTSWTTRFTIASSTGETTEPTETVMVNGKPVGWGTGRLSGASVSLASGSSAAGSTAAGSASASSAPSGMTTIVSSSSSTTVPSTSSTSTSSSDSAPSSSSSSSSSMSSASSSSSTSQVTASAASNSNNAASSSNQTGGAASSNFVFSLGSAALLAIGSSIVIFA